MERQRDEITKEQDAKWLATAAKSKAKRDAHDANRAFLVRALEEKHFGEARAEWQDRLERAGLSDDAWGDMTKAEQISISRALGGDLDEELEEPMVVENLAVVKRAQLMPGPAPILSSASRTSNLSTSSYTLVSPADLGSDDELYAAVSSYVVVSQKVFKRLLDVVNRTSVLSPPTTQRMKIPPYPFPYTTAKVGVTMPAGAPGHQTIVLCMDPQTNTILSPCLT
jgi:hypothetical protein